MFIKQMLEEANILVVLFDNKIHAYGEGLLEGDVNLYVHVNQAEEAIEFIYNLPE